MNKHAPRILLITDIFPPQIGGPATFIPHLAEKLTMEYNFRVTVICTSQKPSDESDVKRPYIIHRLCRNNSYKHRIGLRILFTKEIISHDCILINGLEALTYQVARVFRKPYILKVVGDSVWESARNSGKTVHDFNSFQVDIVEQQKFKTFIKKRNQIVLSAQQVVTPSNYLRQIVINWGVPKERITTIKNGVNLEHFPATPNNIRKNEALRVLFVGRLTNWKGIDTLLYATANVANVNTKIVGDGPELSKLMEISKQLGISQRVEFVGRVSQDVVEQYMSNCHVLILTSLYEGLSHTLLEAMATGLPCIASNLGGNTEVITSGKNGILIEPQNINELTLALTQLEADEALRQSMSKAAKVCSNSFSLNDTVQEYVNLLIKQTGTATA